MNLSHVITRHLLAASLVIAAAFVVPPAAAQAAQLDGKVFVADAGEKGKAADEKADVITFQNGKFHSSLCDQYGYNKGAYKSAAQGDAGPKWAWPPWHYLKHILNVRALFLRVLLIEARSSVCGTSVVV